MAKDDLLTDTGTVVARDFFGLLFFILLSRLFMLQIVEGDFYRELLVSQHYTRSELKANRGHIFMTDK